MGRLITIAFLALFLLPQAALAGAAIGSAAIAAALLYASRRKESAAKPKPDKAPETD